MSATAILRYLYLLQISVRALVADERLYTIAVLTVRYLFIYMWII